MEKRDLKKLREEIIKSYPKREEFVDGVIVAYTGEFEHVHQGYEKLYSWQGGGVRDLGDKLVEKVEIYDINGNKLSSNFETKKSAQKYIDELSKKGITAIIGPAAPYRMNDGTLVSNKGICECGVYIVSSQNEKDFQVNKTKRM